MGDPCEVNTFLGKNFAMFRTFRPATQAPQQTSVEVADGKGKGPARGFTFFPAKAASKVPAALKFIDALKKHVETEALPDDAALEFLKGEGDLKPDNISPHAWGS